MNPAILAQTLALIEQVLPLLGVGASPASLTGTIITTLVKLLPVVLQEARDLTPIVKNIIAALKVGNVTTDQWAQLHAMEKQIDADFDTAAAAALAEDKG